MRDANCFVQQSVGMSKALQTLTPVFLPLHLQEKQRNQISRDSFNCSNIEYKCWKGSSFCYSFLSFLWLDWESLLNLRNHFFPDNLSHHSSWLMWRSVSHLASELCARSFTTPWLMLHLIFPGTGRKSGLASAVCFRCLRRCAVHIGYSLIQPSLYKQYSSSLED